MKHGWYYYFEEKPDIAKVFPEFGTCTNNYQLPKRVKTSNMPMFLKTCVVGVNFKKCLQSSGGGGKGESQADQLLCKVLKYLKYCCADVSLSWDIPESVIDYCLRSVTRISKIDLRLVSKIVWRYWLYERSRTFICLIFAEATVI